MRSIFLATIAVLMAGSSLPALAQVHDYARCETLSEQRAADTGAAHRIFMRECLAGKIPMSTPPVAPTAEHVMRAELFGYCSGLAEARGAQTGIAHRAFMRECMEGKIK